MKKAKLFLYILAALGLMLNVVTLSFAQDNNLFEIAFASYGDAGFDIPTPEAPIIKIYQNGKVILRKGDNYFTGEINTKKLSELKLKLQNNPSLKQSRYFDTEEGDMIGLHGGVAFIRYLDAEQQIIIASSVLSKKGEWQRVTKLVEKYLPKKVELFYPETLEVNIHKNEGEECRSIGGNKPDEWLLGQKISLANNSRRDVVVKDAEVIRFLFKDMYDEGLLWFWWGFCENGVRYTLYTSKIPNWMYDEANLIAGFEAQRLQKSAGQKKQRGK